jgi:hypothetical protein
VWKKRGEPLQNKKVQEKVKFGGGSLMVLECISWNGVGILAEVKGRMNVEMYVFILENNMLSSMGNSGIPKENIIFQKDNQPKTPPKGLKTGSNLMGLGILTGQHSPRS